MLRYIKIISYFAVISNLMTFMKIFTLLKGRLVALTLLALSVVWLGSCNDEEPGPTQNILEIITDNTELSALLAELQAASLDQTLAAPGEFTLFAPSNTAMNNLLTTLGLPDFSPVRAEIAQAVLSYHVVASRVLAADLTDGSSLTSLQTETIDVVAGPELSTGATSNSKIVTADIKATNGVVHIIDVVMIPPTIGDLVVQTLGTVAQPILLGADFSTLSDAIQKAEVYAVTNSLTSLIGTLSDPQATLTVFAPPNTVFAAASIDVDTFTGEQWYGLILHHVTGTIYGDSGTAFAAQSAITMLSQGSVFVLATDAPTDPGNGILSGVVLDSDDDQQADAQIALEDAASGNNGTVHAIAGVLDPN